MPIELRDVTKWASLFSANPKTEQGVDDVARERAFYEGAAAELPFKVARSFSGAAGMAVAPTVCERCGRGGSLGRVRMSDLYVTHYVYLCDSCELERRKRDFDKSYPQRIY